MFSNFSAVDVNDLCSKHLNRGRKAGVLGRRVGDSQRRVLWGKLLFLWAGDVDATQMGSVGERGEGRGQGGGGLPLKGEEVLSFPLETRGKQGSTSGRYKGRRRPGEAETSWSEPPFVSLINGR